MPARKMLRRRLASLLCSGALLMQLGTCTMPTPEEIDAGIARFTDGFVRGFGYGLISNYLLD